MDPFIDFGRELYLPWRILHGEFPHRDYVHPYGPFSVYFNAGMFALFGVSIRTLVLANLLIFAGIVVGLFGLLRRAFGFLPAAAATLVAIVVFGFPHYAGINNYTYAAPYSHEATHGMLMLLLLLLWLGNSAPGRAERGYVAGVWVGLLCLTKTEYVLVAALGVGLGALRAREQAGRWTLFAAAGGGSVLGLAWSALAPVTGAVSAFTSITNAVLAPLRYGAYSSSAHVARFLGWDRAWENLRSVLLYGGAALAVLIVGAIVARYVAKRRGRWPAIVYGVGAVGGAVLLVFRVNWIFCATVFPVLLAAAAGVLIAEGRACRRENRMWATSRRWHQMVGGVAAGGMLARMAFDPTVSHYGFFQAMLAGTWLCAFLLAKWPELGGKSSAVRVAMIAAVLILMGGGAHALWNRSLQFYRLKETPIGEGGDRVWGYRPDVYPLPALWEEARRHIVTRTEVTSTLLVVPEGIALNYWTRRAHPLRITDVLPATLPLHEGNVLSALSQRSPEVVVLLSRPMEELGFAAYGESEPAGKAVVAWLETHYTPEIRPGDYPLGTGAMSLWIYRRNRP